MSQDEGPVLKDSEREAEKSLIMKADEEAVVGEQQKRIKDLIEAQSKQELQKFKNDIMKRI